MFGIPALPTLILGVGGAMFLAYASGHYLGERKGLEVGRAEVQAKWDSERLVQTRRVNDALALARSAESKLATLQQETSDALTHLLSAQQTRDANARRELDSLRDRLTRLGRPGSPGGDGPAASPSPGPSFDALASYTRRVVGECGTRLTTMGERAAGLSIQVTGLQDYARLAQRVCGASD